MSSLEPAKETATEGGSVSISVRNVLTGIGSYSVTFGERDMGFVGGNVQYAGGGARGIPQTEEMKEG